MKHQGVWRVPAAETEDYPNLTVRDGCVSGSINVDHSRLPLWALIWSAVVEGWPSVESNWPQITEDYHFSADDLAKFLYFLLEQRGEFGRLVCVLADVERREYERQEKRGVIGSAWWEHRASKKRVVDQLRVCLAALESA